MRGFAIVYKIMESFVLEGTLIAHLVNVFPVLRALEWRLLIPVQRSQNFILAALAFIHMEEYKHSQVYPFQTTD